MLLMFMFMFCLSTVLQVRRILDTWDDNREGAINLLEFSEIIRDLQVFEQFDGTRWRVLRSVWCLCGCPCGCPFGCRALLPWLPLYCISHAQRMPHLHYLLMPLNVGVACVPCACLSHKHKWCSRLTASLPCLARVLSRPLWLH